MSLTPGIGVAAPRSHVNALPFYIALFCVLWSFAFVAGKIGVTDCPPLILLAGRFSLAGLLILGLSAFRREGWRLGWREVTTFAILGVANNPLYLGLGYTGLKSVSAGLGGLIVSANPIFTAVLAALLLGEALTPRKVLGLLLGIIGVGFVVWHRMSVGTDSPASCSRWLRSHRSWPAPFYSSCSRRKAVSGSAMASRTSPLAWYCCRLPSRSPTSATSCRADGFWGRSPSWCWAARSSLISCGSIC
jgi:drug/metabolite transporter (DMT)-like permease